jgi:hypothetical protein
MKRSLGMPPGATGVYVTGTEPVYDAAQVRMATRAPCRPVRETQAGWGLTVGRPPPPQVLRAGDVLTSVDGHAVADDGAATRVALMPPPRRGPTRLSQAQPAAKAPFQLTGCMQAVCLPAAIRCPHYPCCPRHGPRLAGTFLFPEQNVRIDFRHLPSMRFDGDVMKARSPTRAPPCRHAPCSQHASPCPFRQVAASPSLPHPPASCCSLTTLLPPQAQHTPHTPTNANTPHLPTRSWASGATARRPRWRCAWSRRATWFRRTRTTTSPSITSLRVRRNHLDPVPTSL